MIHADQWASSLLRRNTLKLISLICCFEKDLFPFRVLFNSKANLLFCRRISCVNRNLINFLFITPSSRSYHRSGCLSHNINEYLVCKDFYILLFQSFHWKINILLYQFSKDNSLCVIFGFVKHNLCRLYNQC